MTQPRNMIGQWHIPPAPHRRGPRDEVTFLRDAEIHGCKHAAGDRWACSPYMADRLVAIGCAVRSSDVQPSPPPEPPQPPHAAPSRPSAGVEAREGGDLSRRQKRGRRGGYHGDRG